MTDSHSTKFPSYVGLNSCCCGVLNCTVAGGGAWESRLSQCICALRCAAGVAFAYPQIEALHSNATIDANHNIAKIMLKRIGSPSGWSVRAAYTASSVVVVLEAVLVVVVLVDDVTVVLVTDVDVRDVDVSVVVMPSSVVVVAVVVVVLVQTPHMTGHVVLANDPKSLSRSQLTIGTSFPHTVDSTRP